MPPLHSNSCHAFSFCSACTAPNGPAWHCCHDSNSSPLPSPTHLVSPGLPPLRGALTNLVVQVAQLRSRVQVAASRGAEELDELTRVYEERMAAMRSQLEQQEADKAALLDIVQVWQLRNT